MVPVAAGGQDSGRSRKPWVAWNPRAWLIAVPLVLIVIAAFIPALDNGFVNWDDDKNFLDNPYYRGLGADQVKWAWTTFWVGVYQPLAWLLFEAQYVVWKLDPRGYHLTSLILHAANAVVLYVLTVTVLVRCRPDSLRERPVDVPPGAGLATALFAVHPLRVEAVAWASCQPYLPCALFSMLAVLAYLRAFRIDPSPRWGWLVGLVRPVRGGPAVPGGGGEPAGCAADPGRLPASAIRGGPGPMVRAGGTAESGGEGPVRRREPGLHGAGHRGQRSFTGLGNARTTPRRALPRRATGSGFTSTRRCCRWTRRGVSLARGIWIGSRRGFSRESWQRSR